MEEKLYNIRHSLAHLLAIASLEHDKDAKLSVGPVTDNGFYYDINFSKDKAPAPEDLKSFERTMIKQINKKLSFVRKEVSAEDARKQFANNPYKLAIIDDIEKTGGIVSLYTTGDFVDLCEGKHVENTSEIPAQCFTLTHLAGAYWRGDEKNPMLTRIYGTAFETEEELKTYLLQQEEAKKRDHRKIGQDQELFFIDEMVGKGLVMWLPKGTIIRDTIEKFAVETEEKNGYLRVVTPLIAKEELFLTSGHLPYYKDDMYPPMVMDDGTYYLRAMNCPHHHRIFGHKPHSYRDLPLRYAEYGTVYRNERSGTLAGLLRVRALAMNDAHIYCRKDQVEAEFQSVMKLIMNYFEVFGLGDYWFRLSKWSPEHKEKYIDQPENWEYAESVLRKVLQDMNVNFIEAENEAAFYGPKVDVQFKSIIGREETMSTIQLDFLAKERFSLEYTDSDGSKNNEVFVIHRAPLSTHERFLAFLIEHYAGAFPLWLAPVQVIVLPIGESHQAYAKEITLVLKEKNIRVELDLDNNSLGKRVRNAKMQKTPYLIIIGDKEVEGKCVTLEHRSEGSLGTKTLTECTTLFEKIIASKK